MALNPGDRLAGLLVLDVLTEDGEALLEELPIIDMDIDPDQNVVTMIVTEERIKHI
jgi:hypothetical protein